MSGTPRPGTGTPAQSGLTLPGVGTLSEYSTTRAFLQAVYQQHQQNLKNSPGFTTTEILTNLASASTPVRKANLTGKSVMGVIIRSSYRGDVQDNQYVATINRTADPSPAAPLVNMTTRKYTNHSYGYLRYPEPVDQDKAKFKYVYTEGPIQELSQKAPGNPPPPPVTHRRAAAKLPIPLKYSNARYLGKTTLNGKPVHKFVATYNESGPSPVAPQSNATLQSFTYQFYISKNPVVIQRFEYTSYVRGFQTDQGELNVYNHVVFELTRIGNVTVETPDWIKTPRQKG